HKQPKAVGNDDALGLRAAMTEAGILRAHVRESDRGCFADRAHVDWLRLWRCSMRMRRRSRAFSLTSSTGMTCSCSSRQAYQTKMANAPIRPRMASHQTYQMIAKPQTEAKKATMMPVGVLIGISIG